MNYETLIGGVPLGNWEQLKATLIGVMKDVDTRLSNLEGAEDKEGEGSGS